MLKNAFLKILEHIYKLQNLERAVMCKKTGLEMLTLKSGTISKSGTRSHKQVAK